MIKLFPAQIWTPDYVKALLAVGQFSRVPVVVSGGVSPSNWLQWLESGAAVVGMGTELAGKDIKFDESEINNNVSMATKYKEAVEQWDKKDNIVAASIFKNVFASKLLQKRRQIAEMQQQSQIQSKF